MAYAPPLTAFIPRLQSSEDEEYVGDALKIFSELSTRRNTTASHWEEVSRLILPTSSNTFFYGASNTPGQKKTQSQVDASGMLALHRFAAIMDSLLTPRNMFWHGLGTQNEALKKIPAVRLWYEQATKALFAYRYEAMANFSSQNQNNFISLGAFGTAGMFIDQLVDPWHRPTKGLRYKHVPLGELYIRENHQGIIDSYVRWFRLTARQAWQQFGEHLPATLQTSLQSKSEAPFDFLQFVEPRIDYDPQRIDYKGMPYKSCYVSIQGRWLLNEGGFREFPMAISRYEQVPMETYGRSPAMMVLPALKTLNAEKRVFLKQGHRAADPVLLTADDGIVDYNFRPGSMNKGGVNSDGKALIQVLPTGEIQISKEMMEEEKSLINDAFLVTLFQIMTETPTMTATEVIERTNEKGILLAPTVGRQQSEYIGPLVHRELNLLMSQRLLPPMPRELIEARGQYELVHTSPMTRAMKAQEAAGFVRTVETVKEIVNITQDPQYLDRFNFDAAVPAIAEIQGVPESWMADDKMVMEKRKQRAAAAQQKAQIDAMPAQAAMMKAQNTVQKGQPGIAPGEQGLGGPVQQQG